MAQVGLFKKTGTYLDEKDGKEKPYTNFFAKCGDVYVPIEVRYFEDKDTGRDDRYRERKVLLSAFAESFPERPDNGGKKQDKPKKASSAPSSDSLDEQIPF